MKNYYELLAFIQCYKDLPCLAMMCTIYGNIGDGFSLAIVCWYFLERHHGNIQPHLHIHVAEMIFRLNLGGSHMI